MSARDYFDPESGKTIKEYAIAPRYTPPWLIDPKRKAFDESGDPPEPAQPVIEVVLGLEPYTYEDARRFGEREEAVRKNLLQSWWTKKNYRAKLKGPLWRGSGEFANVLLEITVKHEGSPVGWYDLDQGLVRYATLWDLAHLKQGVPQGELLAKLAIDADEEERVHLGRFVDSKLWLLSERQWDGAEFPPPIKGGPPFVRGVTKEHVDTAAAEAGRVQEMARVTEARAKQILERLLGRRKLNHRIRLEEFHRGINIELEEHADVVRGSKLKAGRIALAHLKEDEHYYTKLKHAGLEEARGYPDMEVQSMQRGARDYDSPDDALASAADRIGAEWYVRDGDEITVFMRVHDGYLKAQLFKRGGWYHWPTDWTGHTRNLPTGARPTPGIEEVYRQERRISADTTSAPPARREAQENPIDTGDGIPWVKVARDPEQYKAALKEAEAIGPIDDEQKIYSLLGPALLKEDQEVFVVVLLDVRQQVRGVAEVHRGSRSRVATSVVDVLRVVIASGAEGFIVVHNHPSGKAQPSGPDKDLTKAIAKAAELFDGDIAFVDHVVCGNGEFYSFADKKLYKAKPDRKAS